MNKLNIYSGLICCPFDKANLQMNANFFECELCGNKYPIINGVPILRGNRNNLKIIEKSHESNNLPKNIIDTIKDHDDKIFVNLGAGSTQDTFKNCLELEYSVFRNTDIVIDAHILPFKDNSIDYIIAMNLFEHLSNPFIAAGEIYRVLKPGGTVLIQTAYLQPVHEAPHHYYGATRYGVENWFKSFSEIETSVSDNFKLEYMLGFLLNSIEFQLSSCLDKEAVEKILNTRLIDWCNFWKDKTSMPIIRNLIENIPEENSFNFSAGIQLIAKK